MNHLSTQSIQNEVSHPWRFLRRNNQNDNQSRFVWCELECQWASLVVPPATGGPPVETLKEAPTNTENQQMFKLFPMPESGPTSTEHPRTPLPATYVRTPLDSMNPIPSTPFYLGLEHCSSPPQLADIPDQLCNHPSSCAKVTMTRCSSWTQKGPAWAMTKVSSNTSTAWRST
jgi:hypothetical protein